MSELILDLEKLGQRPLKVAYDFPAALLDASEEDYAFDSNVTGAVTYTRVGQDVVGSGDLRTLIQTKCARCLDRVETPLIAAVDELWTKKVLPTRDAPGGEEGDHEPDLANVIEGDRIELGELFRELLVAELPARLLCSEDCKGLCTSCGANLNREECQCKKSEEADGEGGETLPAWKRDLKNLRLD